MKQTRAKRADFGVRKGDTVMVIAGGNKKKRPLKGKTGKLLRFTGKNRDRAIVEGLNMSTHHERTTGPGKPGGKIQREQGIHVSNLMYYVEKLQQPVRVRHSILADGKRVRGYTDPKSKKFVEIVNEGK
ncbi:MAG: 50S ribosomal protein L24 [Oligoflexia bacterium]|nr:50S ribosomal protein L24 [Oligoflexia bacterium]